MKRWSSPRLCRRGGLVKPVWRWSSSGHYWRDGLVKLVWRWSSSGHYWRGGLVKRMSSPRHSRSGGPVKMVRNWSSLCHGYRGSLIKLVWSGWRARRSGTNWHCHSQRSQAGLFSAGTSPEDTPCPPRTHTSSFSTPCRYPTARVCIRHHPNNVLILKIVDLRVPRGRGCVRSEPTTRHAPHCPHGGTKGQ